MLGNTNMQYNQRHTVAKMKHIELKMIKLLSSPGIYAEAENILRSTKANIIKAADERVEADLMIDGESFPLVIQKNDERNFDTSCKCGETEHPLCEHKTLLFLQLLDAYGANYFDSIRNWDKEKNKLLALYGYSLSDDLKGKFEFTYTDSKPFLRVMYTSIKRVSLNPAENRPRPVEDQFKRHFNLSPPAQLAQPCRQSHRDQPRQRAIQQLQSLRRVRTALPPRTTQQSIRRIENFHKRHPHIPLIRFAYGMNL